MMRSAEHIARLRCVSAEHGKARRGLAGPGKAWSLAWQGLARLGVAWRGLARYGKERGPAGRGEAGRGLAWHGEERGATRNTRNHIHEVRQ